MSDSDFIQFLATLRVLERTRAIVALHNCNKNACYKSWKNQEALGNIHYFHHKSEEQPIENVQFCALHVNCVKRFGINKDRVWPLAEGSLDTHLATSIFVTDTFVHGNPAHYAARVEPTQLDEIYGTKLEPNVPWVIRSHGDRKSVVFRVYVGDQLSEVTRTLKTMREDEKVAPLLETGEFGLLVLVPSRDDRKPMEEATKHHAKDVRLVVGVGPTAHTLFDHLRTK
jgi:hypothetical protein